MHTALITPIPHLQDLATASHTHLVLAHVAMSSTDAGRYYRRFYRERCAAGEFTILDNGVDEGHTIDLKDMLRFAADELPGVHEIVLPDVQQDGAATIHVCRAALDQLVNDPATRDAYDRAGRPRVMIVPQGKTYAEWQACALHLRRDAYRAIGAGRINDTWTIGLAKNHANTSLVEPELYRRALHDLQRLVFDELRPSVHLLGWPAQLNVLSMVREEYPWVRSIDSARPAAYAKHGIDIGTLYPSVPIPPSRGPEFFTEPLTGDQLVLARMNALTFQALAGDYEAAAGERAL